MSADVSYDPRDGSALGKARHASITARIDVGAAGDVHPASAASAAVAGR